MVPKVVIIILNWNGLRDTRECLGSLKKIDYPNYEITVIDNGSNDGSAEKLEKEFPYVRLIRNRENLGFAGGSNVGILDAMKGNPDYVLLLNNDVVVDRKFLTELINVAEKDAGIGIVGPKIFYHSKRDKIWFAGGMLGHWTGSPYHLGINKKDGEKYSQTREVDFITGCAMLIRAETIKETGGLDTDYFHIAEDVDLCLKAKSKGFKIMYAPGSIVYHKVSSTMGGIFVPFCVYYHTRNILLLNKKNRIARLLYLPSIWFSFARRIFFFLLTGRLKSIGALFAGIVDYHLGRYGKR